MIKSQNFEVQIFLKIYLKVVQKLQVKHIVEKVLSLLNCLKLWNGVEYQSFPAAPYTLMCRNLFMPAG